MSKDKKAAINIKSSRMQFWIGNGAVPTDTVKRLIKSSGALKATAE